MNEIERLLDDLFTLASIHRGFRVRIDRIAAGQVNAAQVKFYRIEETREMMANPLMIPEVVEEQTKENNEGVRSLQRLADRAVRVIRDAGIEMTDQPTPLDTLAYWASGSGLVYHGREIDHAYSLDNAFLEIREKLCNELARITPIGEQMPPSEAALSAEEDTQKKAAHDTKSDTPKNEKKKRPMNRKAADCARRFIADGGIVPMKTIVEDYVDEYGGSAASILRTLNDHPEQWKTRQKDDT